MLFFFSKTRIAKLPGKCENWKIKLSNFSIREIPKSIQKTDENTEKSNNGLTTNPQISHAVHEKSWIKVQN